MNPEIKERLSKHELEYCQRWACKILVSVTDSLMD